MSSDVGFSTQRIKSSYIKYVQRTKDNYLKVTVQYDDTHSVTGKTHNDMEIILKIEKQMEILSNVIETYNA